MITQLLDFTPGLWHGRFEIQVAVIRTVAMQSGTELVR